ncbi:hypothetical protein TNCV_4110511 [Trichonephila clavipes]|nr:hypothetical protein TNCV_4110511 [Trichonephila clavipes]
MDPEKSASRTNTSSSNSSTYKPRHWIKQISDGTYRFVVDHTIEDAPFCDAASSVDVAMVSDQRVHAAVNVTYVASWCSSFNSE